MRRWLVVSALLCSSIALGQAKTLFEEGAALFERGEFDAAAERFEASYFARPVPVTKFNAARSWEKAGRTLKAIDAWQAWLAMSPNAPQRPEAEASLRALGQKMAKQGVQALTVTTLPVHARVSVDGVTVGEAPITVELTPMRHLIRTELDGRESVERTIELTLDMPRAVMIELPPGSNAPATSLPPTPSAPLVDADNFVHPEVPRGGNTPPEFHPDVPRSTGAAFPVMRGNADDSVEVHIESNERGTKLFRVGNNQLTGECTAPCDKRIVNANDYFYVGGLSVTPSKTFILTDHSHRGQVNLKVRAGSPGLLFGLGVPLMTVGIASTIVGLVFAILPSYGSFDRGPPMAIGLSVGIGSIVASIIIMATQATTVKFLD
ncbi:MAG: PEGA domain-containing protein [Myxococcaceae bacterium]